MLELMSDNLIKMFQIFVDSFDKFTNIVKGWSIVSWTIA